MFKSKRIHIFIAFILSSYTVYCQSDVSSILAGYKKTLKTSDSYKVNISYKLYNEHTSKAPTEVEKGVLYKNELGSYINFGGVEMINKPSFHIKINKAERAILVADGIGSSDNITFNLEELYTYLNVSLVKELPNSWHLKFRAKEGFSDVEFSSLEVFIEKGSYRVLKQVFFYGAMDFSTRSVEADASKMKLEVLYSNYSAVPPSKFHRIFEITNYVVLGKSPTPTPSLKYKGYEVLDIRSKK